MMKEEINQMKEKLSEMEKKQIEQEQLLKERNESLNKREKSLDFNDEPSYKKLGSSRMSINSKGSRVSAKGIEERANINRDR